jgi:hypothetical protein
MVMKISYRVARPEDFHDESSGYSDEDAHLRGARGGAW